MPTALSLSLSGLVKRKGGGGGRGGGMYTASYVYSQPFSLSLLYILILIFSADTCICKTIELVNFTGETSTHRTGLDWTGLVCTYVHKTT